MDLDKVANRFAYAAGLSKEDAVAIIGSVKDVLIEQQEEDS